ncbi:MAG TPA: 16S rRNA (uracil(1498)-N(3))-methyltransferase [Mycobacteriales bacterium]|jgi:16S rRNA (uracil1498-N3)-methyltransferase|nr:16S rRNA (uracil(1498)-N(3))-methyltransferase [Mycobacteriales bacterium]
MTAATAAPVFLVEELPTGGRTVLDGAEGRHAATVRRIEVGEFVALTDGAGGMAECTVTATGRDRLELDVLRLSQLTPPQPRLVVVQALPKGDRGQLAVELMTELGVDEVVPWAAARCEAKWPADRVERGLSRWRATARTAAKQARRAWLPVISQPASTRGVCSLLSSAASGIVLHEQASRPLGSVPLPESGDLVLVVGPEGGLTEGEVTAFRAAGARSVRLGPTVLRTSTAGAAALAALGAGTGRWR